MTVWFVFGFLVWISIVLECKSAIENDRSIRHPNRITNSEIENTFKRCLGEANDMKNMERKLAQQGGVVRGKQSDLCLMRRVKTDPVVYDCEHAQLPFQLVTQTFIQRYNLSQNELEELSRDFGGEYSSRASEDCTSHTQLPAPCDPNSKYRTADGTCNSLDNPRWGSVGICHRRLLPASYVGASDFRQSVMGGPLPPPRQLSLNTHPHYNNPTSYVSHMYQFFGQLLDHDIAMTPLSLTVDNQPIECCPPSSPSHPQCAPILIPRDDNFYSRFGVTCLNFPRSAICPTCALGAREQPNQVTAFIDASFIYGNSLNETANLRANDGTGKMRVERSQVGDLLPTSPNPQNDLCSFPATNDICFEAGDPRANQHTTLASLHTVFLREHNRIAEELGFINPHWSEEILFQEARRIMGAQMQVITYKEYLPITLGDERTTFFSLWLDDSFTSYDPTLDPTLYNEFATAAFRFGHSLINGLVTRTPPSLSNGPRMLRDEYFQPFELREGLVGPLLRGVSNSPAQKFDRNMVEDVTNYLFRIRGNQTGLDLAAIDIQRGRDHGMPRYIDMVRYCSENQVRINNFNDLWRQKLMTENNAEVLRYNYRHIGDIDLFTGILMEMPLDNAVVGPTAVCVIGMQFNHLKFGDRFYFQHSYQRTSFTYQQIEELKKTSLSKIICSNTDITKISLNAMLYNSRSNPSINCKFVKGIDLSYWKD